MVKFLTLSCSKEYISLINIIVFKKYIFENNVK